MPFGAHLFAGGQPRQQLAQDLVHAHQVGLGGGDLVVADGGGHFGLGLFPFLVQEPAEAVEGFVDVLGVGAQVDQDHGGGAGLIEVVGRHVGATPPRKMRSMVPASIDPGRHPWRP